MQLVTATIPILVLQVRQYTVCTHPHLSIAGKTVYSMHSTTAKKRCVLN